MIRRYPDGAARRRDLTRRLDRMRWRAQEHETPPRTDGLGTFFYRISPMDAANADLSGHLARTDVG